MEEREFELVNIIGGDLGANQRDLAEQMNLSLGMTNMLIRRLITKGYIRIRQLNKKKVEYILTPKGFAEKMQKSVNYMRKTINSIGLVKQSLAGLLKEAHDTGVRKFYILGGSDLAGLIEMTAREVYGSEIELLRVEALGAGMADGVVLICREHVPLTGFETLRVVNVIEELAKSQGLVGQTMPASV